MSAASGITPRISNPVRWLRFAAFWTVIAFCWLVILPWLARQPARAARIDALQRAGIDPSAMYYSELEMMPDTLRRLEQLHARDSNLFWGRSTSSAN